jgi:hypothetical protein
LFVAIVQLLVGIPIYAMFRCIFVIDQAEVVLEQKYPIDKKFN